MLERLRGVKTHTLSGVQVRAIGESLVYKRLDLKRGGEGTGQGERTGYDTVKSRLKAQVTEKGWKSDAIYQINLSRRDRRLAMRALRFSMREPRMIADFAVTQAELPEVGSDDWGLGIPETNLSTIRAKKLQHAAHLAWTALETQQVLATGQADRRPRINQEPVNSLA